MPDLKISDKSEVQQTAGATVSPEKAGVKVTAEKSALPVSAAPKNMYDFENRWINNLDMQSRASMIVALVKQNTSLPAFFGSSLTPEMLDEILECLKSS